MESKSCLHAIDRHDNSMSRVVPSSAPSANINVGCQNVNELPLSLVAPLGAQNN